MKAEAIVEMIKRLIEACREGEYFFRSSTKHAPINLHPKLLRRAYVYQRNIDGLEKLGQSFGLKLETCGSDSPCGRVAMWAESCTNELILSKCIETEETIHQLYLLALTEPPPTEILDVLQRQFNNVSKNHAWVTSWLKEWQAWELKQERERAYRQAVREHHEDLMGD